MASNFIKRAITGVLFVAILVGCILYTSFSFGILFIIISALTIYEFGQLVNMRADGVNVNKTIIMLGGAYLFLAVMGFCIDAADSKIFIPYVLLLLYLMISELYLKKENPVLNWAYSMLSQLYIGLPFALLNVLAFHNDPSSEYSSVSYNPILPLSIFIFLWLRQEVRLKNAYIVKCTGCKKDENGIITEVYCEYDANTRSGMPDANRKVKGTLHWVSCNHLGERWHECNKDARRNSNDAKFYR